MRADVHRAGYVQWYTRGDRGTIIGMGFGKRTQGEGNMYAVHEEGHICGAIGQYNEMEADVY